MGAFWTKIRSGFSLIFDAKSTRWPHSTRSVARNILIASIVAAIAELSVCVVLPHQLLPMKNTVSCRQNVNLGLSNYDLGAVWPDLLLREEVELPVTFANADMLMSGENSLDEHLVFGPKYLSVRKRADTLTIVSNLILGPVFLPILITTMLACHSCRRSITNRAGMLGAVCFLLYFLSNMLGAIANNVYLFDVYEEFPTCWQSDNDMMKLEEQAQHAQNIVHGAAAMGLVGAISMAFLFIVSVIAAHYNRRMDPGQSIPLDNLRGHHSNVPNNMRVSSPAAGFGHGATAAPNTPSVPEAAAGREGREYPAKKITRDEVAAERRMEELRDCRNPFADPEDPFRDPVRDAEAATQYPETGRCR